MFNNDSLAAIYDYRYRTAVETYVLSTLQLLRALVSGIHPRPVSTKTEGTWQKAAKREATVLKSSILVF